MANRKIILLIAITLALAATSSYFWIKLSATEIELRVTREVSGIVVKKPRADVLSFAKTFVEKVLAAEGEISFEDRLKLENDVRELNDEEILNQWMMFAESNTEEVAQKEVINLLSLLLEKIKN